MSFGERIRKLRNERHLLIQELANRAGLSAATISQVERSLFIPPDDTVRKLIDALGKVGKPINNNTRDELFHVLKKDRAEKEYEPKESLAFGGALRDLLKRLNLSGSALTSRPRSTIHAWVKGILLPNDKTLVEELIPEVKGLGASDSDLKSLYLAHLHDVLDKSLQLEYLTENMQKEIILQTIGQAEFVMFPNQKVATSSGRRYREFSDE